MQEEAGFLKRIDLWLIIFFGKKISKTSDIRFAQSDYRTLFDNIKESFNATGTKIDKILSVILIISIILAIFMVVYVIITPKEGEKFTEFYLLGPGGKAEDYPTNLNVGEDGEVIIGIVNHEFYIQGDKSRRRPEIRVFTI
jgi:uncharacterized membrane protein